MQSYPTKSEKVKPSVEGRLILELRDGRLNYYPATNSDEETRELLDAVFDHIKRAIERGQHVS